MMHAINDLRIGDRVVLTNCSGSPGTVLEQRHGKLLVRFDDLPAVKWLLRSSSLELAAVDKNVHSQTKGFSQ